jgi:hypothetical protein
MSRAPQSHNRTGPWARRLHSDVSQHTGLQRVLRRGCPRFDRRNDFLDERIQHGTINPPDDNDEIIFPVDVHNVVASSPKGHAGLGSRRQIGIQKPIHVAMVRVGDPWRARHLNPFFGNNLPADPGLEATELDCIRLPPAEASVGHGSVSSPWRRGLRRASGVAAVGRLGAALRRPQALERARHDGRNRVQPEASLALSDLKRSAMTRAFMGPQPGGRLTAGRDHQAEKSELFVQHQH